MITYLRFRQAMHFRGQLESLPYRTPLQPYATWIALIIVSILRFDFQHRRLNSAREGLGCCPDLVADPPPHR